MDYGILNSCRLCPRKCGAKRSENLEGFCGAKKEIKAARASLHMWEEPCISGKNGSGTVFFSGCPLKCVFCQNSAVSRDCCGKEIEACRLAEIFLELQDKKAANINLVSPTPYVPHIIKALEIAKLRGLSIPIVYNSSGYELTDTLRMLDGLVDIYLPDFKYMSDELSMKYSSVHDYALHAKNAISEMVRQQPSPVFDADGMMKRGVIVRHLVLPDCTADSKKVILYLRQTYLDKIYISIMSQYTPVGDLKNYPELMRHLSFGEYDDVVDYAVDIGVTQGFIQDGESVGESFIPVFDCRGI